jgi:hypothetical protein
MRTCLLLILFVRADHVRLWPVFRIHIRIRRFTSVRIRFQIRALCAITLRVKFSTLLLSLFKFASFLSCYNFEVNFTHLDKLNTKWSSCKRHFWKVGDQNSVVIFASVTATLSGSERAIWKADQDLKHCLWPTSVGDPHPFFRVTDPDPSLVS